MDRDDFIITVYCLVCEHYQVIKERYPLRRGGFAPALTDEEVITMEICGEYFKCATDQDIFDYFRAHYRHFFPRLTDRTLFVRQAANLWQVKAAIQQRLTIVSGQAADPVQVIDTLPLPVCGYTRAPRDRCFKPAADYGYCAAKKLEYYGFKLGLRVARSGMITYYPLLPAPTISTSSTIWSRALQGSCPPTKALLTQSGRRCCKNDKALSSLRPHAKAWLPATVPTC